MNRTHPLKCWNVDLHKILRFWFEIFSFTYHFLLSFYVKGRTIFDSYWRFMEVRHRLYCWINCTKWNCKRNALCSFTSMYLRWCFADIINFMDFSNYPVQDMLTCTISSEFDLQYDPLQTISCFRFMLKELVSFERLTSSSTVWFLPRNRGLTKHGVEFNFQKLVPKNRKLTDIPRYKFYRSGASASVIFFKCARRIGFGPISMKMFFFSKSIAE
jgi:hypothetical protein